MSNCPHWDINEPVQKRFEPVDANLEELPARTTESLVANIARTWNERVNLMAEVFAALEICTWRKRRNRI